MKKVKIQGHEYTLRNGDEVTLGAEKLVNHERNVAEIAMLSNEDIKKQLKENKTGDKHKKELSNEEALMLLDDIKKSLIDVQDAAFMPGEEAIMYSANLSRSEIDDLPKKVFEELAKAADEELGGLLNFTKTSTTDTT